ncbi:MAG: histidine kinase [Bacteroidota bacterium]
MTNYYKDIRYATVIVAIICLVTITLNFAMTGSLSWGLIKNQIFYNIYYGFPLTIIIGNFSGFLNKIFPWDSRPRRRALWGIFGSITLTLFVLFILNLILWIGIWGYDFKAIYLQENRDFYLWAVIITIIVSITLHAASFFKEIQKERKVSAQLKQEKLEMELNALRAHVDPHFLFNSFNVLSGLIDEDPERAQDFLAGLSKIYRYILEQRNEDTSTLKDEINFAQRYLSLQKMRFEDSIIMETDIDPNLESRKIPSLSLQLLLENAIKHNGFNKDAPLQIHLKTNGSTLEVVNNKMQRTNLYEGNKMGLQNIKDRYALLTNQAVEVNNLTESFSVKLPLL